MTEETDDSDVLPCLSDLLQETIRNRQERAHIAAFLAHRPVLPPTGEIVLFSEIYWRGWSPRKMPAGDPASGSLLFAELPRWRLPTQADAIAHQVPEDIEAFEIVDLPSLLCGDDDEAFHRSVVGLCVYLSTCHTQTYDSTGASSGAYVYTFDRLLRTVLHRIPPVQATFEDGIAGIDLLRREIPFFFELREIHQGCNGRILPLKA